MCTKSLEPLFTEEKNLYNINNNFYNMNLDNQVSPLTISPSQAYTNPNTQGYAPICYNTTNSNQQYSYNDTSSIQNTIPPMQPAAYSNYNEVNHPYSIMPTLPQECNNAKSICLPTINHASPPYDSFNNAKINNSYKYSEIRVKQENDINNDQVDTISDDKFFKAYYQFTNLIITGQSNQILAPKFICKIDRGFFFSGNKLTCYRRNYFQINCILQLENEYGNQVELNNVHHLMIGIKGQLIPIKRLKLGLKANSETDGQEIELIQHTTKRDKGPRDSPKLRTILPSNKGLNYLNKSVTFDRLQFKKATANNGRRRVAHTYFNLSLQLFAELEDGTLVLLTTRRSHSIVVRGRSPGHYTDNGGIYPFKRAQFKKVNAEYPIKLDDPRNVTEQIEPNEATTSMQSSQVYYPQQEYNYQQQITHTGQNSTYYDNVTQGNYHYYTSSAMMNPGSYYFNPGYNTPNHSALPSNNGSPEASINQNYYVIGQNNTLNYNS